MRPEDFREGTVERAVADYYEGNLQTIAEFEEAIQKAGPDAMTEFIINCQSKGWFKGKLHE